MYFFVSEVSVYYNEWMLLLLWLVHFFFYSFVVCKGSFPLLPEKVVAFHMDPAIWKFLPFEIIEILFHWRPLSVLMTFKMVCRQWCIVLEKSISLVSFDRCCQNELGFISFLTHFANDCLIGSYLNNSGLLFTIMFPFFILHTELNIQWDQWFFLAFLQVICIQKIVWLSTLLRICLETLDFLLLGSEYSSPYWKNSVHENMNRYLWNMFLKTWTHIFSFAVVLTIIGRGRGFHTVV